MKMLAFENSPNTMALADLIRSNREFYKEIFEENREKFSIREVAKRVGCSPSYYEEIEQGKQELSSIKLIYGIALTLDLSMDYLVKIYLDLSYEEMFKNFGGENNISYYGYSNSDILTSSATLGKTQYEIADSIGCSRSHYCRIVAGKREFKDIRLVYKLSKLLSIPMYVLIRNELNLSDEDMAKVISVPQSQKAMKVEVAIPDDKTVEMRTELFNLIADFSPSELKIAYAKLSEIKK